MAESRDILLAISFDVLFVRRSFVAGTDLEPDRCAFKPKCCTNLVFEEALEGKMQLDVTVGEKDESGWGNGGLGHVEDADALRHGDAGALEIDLVEEAIHLAGGDALAALGGDAQNRVENARDVAAFSGGDEKHGRVAEVFEDGAELALEDGAVGGRLAIRPPARNEVPLIHDDDDGAATLVRVAADGGVRGSDAF